MTKDTKELRVSAIKNGTAIDHIPADSLFNVINILGLDKIQNTITFGTNLDSQTQGKKAIIKISEKYFEKSEINKIALVAPNAKLNIIKDYEVVQKQIIELPDSFQGIVKCVNPKCITNVENVKTKFTVVDKKELKLKCHYCEKITNKNNIEVVK
jgi:aspartate carbamoyltransferase regulatory subunit